MRDKRFDGLDDRIRNCELLIGEANTRLADGLEAVNRLCGHLQEQINVLAEVNGLSLEDENGRKGDQDLP